MESTTDSSGGSTRHPHLPPGFRFHPTDEELVVHYLKKKTDAIPIPVAIIADIDLYKFDPWELPAKATFGEQEWYFFSPRERKYPNGARPNRAATSGYWKATGTDKPVLTAGGSQKVGVKKALVFYGGKPPKGVKTNWIMHEYRIVDNKPVQKPPGYDHGKKKGSLRLDDWVLCRIYKKSNAQRPMDHQERDYNDTNEIIIGSIPPTISMITASNYTSLLENNQNMYQGMMNNNSIDTNATTISNLLPAKRSLQNLYSWNEEENENSPSTNSVETIMQQQAMLGNIGDGVYGQQSNYQVNGMNWYM